MNSFYFGAECANQLVPKSVLSNLQPIWQPQRKAIFYSMMNSHSNIKVEPNVFAYPLYRPFGWSNRLSRAKSVIQTLIQNWHNYMKTIISEHILSYTMKRTHRSRRWHDKHWYSHHRITCRQLKFSQHFPKKTKCTKS